MERDSDTDSTKTPSAAGKLQSFSTHRPSVQTNITTPARSSYSKTVTSQATKATLSNPSPSKRGEAARLHTHTPCPAIEESSQSPPTSVSTMSPRLGVSKVKPAVPEIKKRLQYHQEELTRRGQEVDNVRTRYGDYKGHQVESSEHDGNPIQDEEASDRNDFAVDRDKCQESQIGKPPLGETLLHNQEPSAINELPEMKEEGINLTNKPINKPTESSPSGSHRPDRTLLTGVARNRYPCSPSPARQSDMHECIWRRLFLEEQRFEIANEGRRADRTEIGVGPGNIEKGLARGIRIWHKEGENKDLGFKGVTLLVHRDGGEDLVLVCEV